MKQATFDPARRLDLYFRCSRAGSKNFVFTYSDGSAYSFIYQEFQFNIYRYEGEKKVLLNLLTFTNQNTLTSQITVSQSNISEGEYYYELFNTDTDETWLCGNAIFHNGKFDGVNSETSDITIQINGETISITLEVTPSSGSVSSFSSGNLSPLFTTSVDTATTTPALTFTLVNQNANLVYAGPATAPASAPTFRALVAADLPSDSSAYWKTAGTVTLTANNTISGSGSGFKIGFTNTAIGIGVAPASITSGKVLDVLGSSLFTGDIDITGKLTINWTSETPISLTGSVTDANGSGNAHFIQDLVTITRTGNMAYTSFDSRMTFGGASNTFDHHASFQSIITYDVGTTMTNHYALYDRPTVNAGATITNRYGLYLLPHTGAGAVTNDYGIYIGTLLGTTNWSIYSLGGPAYFSKSTSATATLLSLVRAGSTNGTETGIDFISNGGGTAFTPAQITAKSNTSTSGDLLIYTNNTGTSSTTLTATFKDDGSFRLGRGAMSTGIDGTAPLPAYAFSGDLTMGMWRNADKLAFSTGGSTRVQIDATGAMSVGGSVVPGARMTVQHPTASTESATQYINGSTGSGSSNGFFVGVGADNLAMVWYKSGAALKFATNNAERARFGATTGNLSIGTSTDAARLYLLQGVLTSSWVPVFRSDPGAHTGMTAATEFVSNDFRGATQTWADGTVTTQRFNYFRGFTVNKTTSTATFTDIFTDFTESSTAGSGVTFTRNWAAGFNGNVLIGASAGTTGSILLELNSTTRALLLTRMTKTQRDAISTPVAGMLVYQTDNTPGLRAYNGTNWMRFTETAD